MASPPRSAVQLLISMTNAKEMQAARAARTLHDEVGQVLSGVGLQLDVLRLDFTGRIPEIGARTAEIQSYLETAITQVRELSAQLNPAIVERAGLQFALEHLAGRYRKGFAGAIRLMYDSGSRFPVHVANAFYKIAESALENATAHSGGTRVEVLVRPSRGTICLEVRDDGRGFDVAEARRHDLGLGLLLMDHHSEQAGITLTINSVTGKGTTIKATHRPAPPVDGGRVPVTKGRL